MLRSFHHTLARFSRQSYTLCNMQSNLSSLEPEKISGDLRNIIFVDKIPYTAVTEGKAEVLFPSSHDVFYNPVQEFNRDLSIAVLKQFFKEFTADRLNKNEIKQEKNLEKETSILSPEFRILEALAASGLRSIRFAKEISHPVKIIANDRSSQAFQSIRRNITHNNVENIVEACNEDASLLMYKNRQFKCRFDVIDLDPYGTAAPFLDSAVQSVLDGGLLMVTCTDMAILCGNGVEACHAKYGAVSSKSSNCHEMALRIVLQCIESHANRYGRYIVPVLSMSVDFYVRIFVRVYTSPILVKQSICKLAMVYVCPSCGSFHLQRLGTKIKTDKGGEKFSPSSGPPVSMECNICKGHHKMCGPIWSDNLHDPDFVQRVLQAVDQEKESYGTSKRILGMLNVILEELVDCPLFHKVERLSSTLHVVSPTNIQIRSAILNAGYKVSISHTSPTSIKTDAPQDVIWDIMRAWAKQNPGKKTFLNEPSKTIMSSEPKIEISFDVHPEADPQSRSSHLLRFQINPTPNWGPKCRATTSLFKSKEEDKRLRRQNKRLRKEDDTSEMKENHKKSKNEAQVNENS